MKNRIINTPIPRQSDRPQPKSSFILSGPKKLTKSTTASLIICAVPYSRVSFEAIPVKKGLPYLLFVLYSRLRSFRPSCVNGFLEKLFQGKPGAVNAVSWVRSHHSEILDDVSLVDWLYGIMEKAKAGAYRASIGSAHTVGETQMCANRDRDQNRYVEE